MYGFLPCNRNAVSLISSDVCSLLISKTIVSTSTYTRFLSAAAEVKDLWWYDRRGRARGKSLFSLHFELRAILNNELLAKATFTSRKIIPIVTSVSEQKVSWHKLRERLFSPRWFYPSTQRLAIRKSCRSNGTQKIENPRYISLICIERWEGESVGNMQWSNETA